MWTENARKLLTKYGEVLEDRTVCTHQFIEARVGGQRIQVMCGGGVVLLARLKFSEERSVCDMTGPLTEMLALAMTKDHRWYCNRRKVWISVEWKAKCGHLKRDVSLYIDNEPFTSGNPMFKAMLEGAIEDNSPSPLLDWIEDNELGSKP